MFIPGLNRMIVGVGTMRENVRKAAIAEIARTAKIS